jgi:transposase-like protein
MRRYYTDRQRTELVELVRSGRTATAIAAARLGVTASTAYGWVKRAGVAAPQRKADRSTGPRKTQPGVPPAFVRLVRAGDLDAAIAVRIGSAEIQIRRGFDAELLGAVVQALRETAA